MLEFKTATLRWSNLRTSSHAERNGVNTHTDGRTHMHQWWFNIVLPYGTLSQWTDAESAEFPSQLQICGSKHIHVQIQVTGSTKLRQANYQA